MDAPVVGPPMFPVGDVKDLRSRDVSAVTAEGVALVVIRTRDGLKVVENRCPHQQAEILHEGTIESNGLTCPMHGRTFDLVDGVCRNGSGRLTFLPSAEREGILWTSLPQLPEYPGF